MSQNQQPRPSSQPQARTESDQLDKEIADSRQTLAAIRNEIREAEEFRQKQEADLAHDLALQASHKKAAHLKAMSDLEEDLAKKKAERDKLEHAVSELKDHILKLDNDQLQVHRELKFNTDRHEQQVQTLSATKQRLEMEVTNAQAELDRYMTKITEATNQLAIVKQKIVQTEQSYVSRIGILQRQEKEAEEKRNEMITQLQEYSSAYDQLTEKERNRVADLEAREHQLTARTRKFNEERIEFAAQRRRYEQTRQLQ